MRYSCIIWFISILFFSSVSAATPIEEGAPTWEAQICQETLFQLQGNTKTIVGFGQEYQVISASGSIEDVQVNFRLVRDGKQVEEKQGIKYIRIFNQAGNLTLFANVQDRDCRYEYKKEIQVYSEQYLYIWNQVQNIEENFSDFFEKNNILFESFPQKQDAVDISTSQGGTNLIQKHREAFTQSKKIFIDESVSINMLDSFVKSLRIYKDMSFGQKDIFIITSRNNSFLSKVLAPYIQQLGVTKIGFIKKDSFLDTVSAIVAATPANISYISFEKEQGFFSLNIFIRYLTYSGLELSFIGLFLSMALAILLINISKQFLGLNVFGLYYPILLSLSLVLLSFSFVCMFLMLSFCSLCSVSFLSQTTYLWHISKKAVLLTIFLILTLLFLGIDNYFSLGIIDISAFSHAFILFPFLLLLLISDTILQKEVTILSQKGLVQFWELSFITLLCYGIMSSTGVQYFLLTFPDLLFVFLLLNILVARYTGLQLREYLRFTPLFKKLSEEK